MSESERVIAQLRQILDGIDATETDRAEGWWETGTGAEFGAGKLAEVEALIRSFIEPAGNE